MSFLYRDHRGSLEDSMKTVQEMESFKDLQKHLFSIYGKGEITIKPYTFDSRIDWETYIVCIDGKAVGFTNDGVAPLTYTMIDEDGVKWRFDGSRPISEIADMVMAQVEGKRK